MSTPEHKEQEDPARVDEPTQLATQRATATYSEALRPLVRTGVMANQQCPCCECRGIKCLMGHPGHSHHSPGYAGHPWRR